MTNSSPTKSPLSSFQRILVLIFAIGLAGVLFVLRAGFNSRQTLSELARRSLEPEVALANNKPTILEFYADWCEVCQEMAPAIISAEKLNREKLDIVLLNVDNPKWLDLISLYSVNGIPQMNFFDQFGELQGKSIGLRNLDEIMLISDSLITNNQLPEFIGMNRELRQSSITTKDSLKVVKPKSHG